MNIRFIYITALLLAFTGVTLAQTPLSISVGSKYTPSVPGILYVKFKKPVDVTKITTTATGNGNIDAVFAKLGVTATERYDPNPTAIAKRIGMDRIVKLTFNNTELSTDAAADLFFALEEVESVRPLFLFKSCSAVNDPRFSEQWGLTKMQVPQAWDFSKGDTSIVIAICDLGVNYHHEDLEANLATNPGETGLDGSGKDKKTNGTDDDQDGYIDNWRGWDFGGVGTFTKPKPDNNPLPGPNHNHGTISAGCAAAVTNNSKGIASPGFNCRFMPLKIVIDSSDNIPWGYDAIRYAAQHGAKIINCSWGGYVQPKYKPAIQDFVDEALEYGALVVAASGNFTLNTDDSDFYPACLDRVLGVGATDENDKASGFSNYGKRIDVYAPGSNIISTGFPGDIYSSGNSGTSFSCPYVSGIAGLVLAKHPKWTPNVVIKHMVNTCDPMTPANKNLYWGRVNAQSLLSRAPSFPGLIITSFSIDGVDSAALPYLNKEYSLGVTFENVANTAALSATLIPVEGYNVIKGYSSLGSVKTNEKSTATFAFTRDSLDDGIILPMKIAVTDTKSYYDTMWIYVDISGDAVYVPVSVKGDPIPTAALRVYPNPATSEVQCYFQLTTYGSVSVRLCDELGRTVKAADCGTFAQGENHLSVPISGLSAGVYTIHLASNTGERMVSRVVVQ